MLSWLLDILHASHPTCRLDTHINLSNGDMRTLSNVAGSSCLVSLDVCVGHSRSMYREVMKTVSSCPNVRDVCITTAERGDENFDPTGKSSQLLKLRSFELDFGERYVPENCSSAHGSYDSSTNVSDL